jgi:hypothetical protein
MHGTSRNRIVRISRSGPCWFGCISTNQNNAHSPKVNRRVGSRAKPDVLEEIVRRIKALSDPREKAAGGPERGGPPVPQLHEKAGPPGEQRARRRENSEHYIQFDWPVLVVASIRRVVDAVRDGGRV